MKDERLATHGWPLALEGRAAHNPVPSRLPGITP